MKTVDVLIAAKALISDPKAFYRTRLDRKDRRGWITGSIFRDANGKICLKNSEATCFCSLGAVNKVVGADAESTGSGIVPTDEYPDDFYLERETARPTQAQRKAFTTAKKYLDAASQMIGQSKTRDVISLNDSGFHEAVMSMFDLAIKNAKRRHVNG